MEWIAVEKHYLGLRAGIRTGAVITDECEREREGERERSRERRWAKVTVKNQVRRKRKNIKKQNLKFEVGWTRKRKRKRGEQPNGQRI